VVCRPGCTPCCLGPFAISGLDAARLRYGLGVLDHEDPARAARVRERSERYSAAIALHFPGDAATGALTDDELLPDEWDQEACPALDPASGRCDLYEWRPLTCRLFGAAMRLDGGPVGACELCYEGATDEQIAGAAGAVSPGEAEQALLDEIAQFPTIVAFALSIRGEHSE